MSLSSKGADVPVYSFFHVELADVEFFALECYVHVEEKGTEECLFDPTEVPA